MSPAPAKPHSPSLSTHAPAVTTATSRLRLTLRLTTRRRLSSSDGTGSNHLESSCRVRSLVVCRLLTSSSGLISGTVDVGAATTQTFTVVATDANGVPSSGRSLTITVNPSPIRDDRRAWRRLRMGSRATTRPCPKRRNYADLLDCLVWIASHWSCLCSSSGLISGTADANFGDQRDVHGGRHGRERGVASPGKIAHPHCQRQHRQSRHCAALRRRRTRRSATRRRLRLNRWDCTGRVECLVWVASGQSDAHNLTPESHLRHHGRRLGDDSDVHSRRDRRERRSFDRHLPHHHRQRRAHRHDSEPCDSDGHSDWLLPDACVQRRDCTHRVDYLVWCPSGRAYPRRGHGESSPARWTPAPRLRPSR